jgi:hypothetical protein
MKSKMTRRDALKLGTGTALSAALGTSATTIERNTATSNSEDEICFMRAVDMVDAIRSRKLSSREVMQAHLQQIQRVNAKVNAMVTMVPEEQLMAQAAAADEALAHGKWLGPLHGLPVAVKDLHETTGIRTTFGSPLHKNYVPDFDCRVVQREKEAGAIILGKTNVPEFGLGSQTFNPVFGPTLNPYDITKTCGGSTGGGGGGGRVRNGSPGRRQRHGRLSAQSSQLLQHSRDPNLARTRVQRAYRLRLGYPFCSRTRRSQRDRLRLFPERAGGL